MEKRDGEQKKEGRCEGRRLRGWRDWIGWVVSTKEMFMQTMIKVIMIKLQSKSIFFKSGLIYFYY